MCKRQKNDFPGEFRAKILSTLYKTYKRNVLNVVRSLKGEFSEILLHAVVHKFKHIVFDRKLISNTNATRFIHGYTCVTMDFLPCTYLIYLTNA